VELSVTSREGGFELVVDQPPRLSPREVAGSNAAGATYQATEIIPSTCLLLAPLRHGDRPCDVRFQGKTGSSWPTTKMTQLTHLRHWAALKKVHDLT
jgi:hypothetical protein